MCCRRRAATSSSTIAVVTVAFLYASFRLYPILSTALGVNVVAADPVSTTSRACVVRPLRPMTPASTRSSSRLRLKKLELFVIEDKRGSDQRDRGILREPDGEPRVLRFEITDRLEGSHVRCAIPDDTCADDVGITAARGGPRRRGTRTDQDIGGRSPPTSAARSRRTRVARQHPCVHHSVPVRPSSFCCATAPSRRSTDA